MSETNMSGQQMERRVCAPMNAELRVVPSGDGPGKLVGYAAKFNKWSVNLGDFIERIKPGAFTNALIGADIRGLKNHDANLLLGRTTAGTLRLQEDASGLGFTIDLPNTGAGRDVAEEVRRGDLSGCSFSFAVAAKGDKWHEEAGVVRRTIHEFKRIFDVGPVTFPAYPDTTVAARSLEQFRAGGHAGGRRAKTIGEMQAVVNAANHAKCARELKNAKDRLRA